MTEDLLHSINKFLDSKDDISTEDQQLLIVPICRLALTVVPDVQTKIYEHIVAKEIGATVYKKLTGPDLITKDGKTMEVKQSTMKQKTKKCNFSWPIPTGTTTEERRQQLVASAIAKGDARCDLINGRVELIKSYSIKATFLSEFFSRVPINDKTKSINLGSTFCHTCKTCPRMDKFQKLSDKFPKLDEEDWKNSLGREPKHEC